MASVINKINTGSTEYAIASTAYATCSTAASTPGKVAFMHFYMMEPIGSLLMEGQLL